MRYFSRGIIVMYSDFPRCLKVMLHGSTILNDDF